MRGIDWFWVAIVVIGYANMSYWVSQSDMDLFYKVLVIVALITASLEYAVRRIDEVS